MPATVREVDHEGSICVAFLPDEDESRWVEPNDLNLASLDLTSIRGCEFDGDEMKKAVEAAEDLIYSMSKHKKINPKVVLKRLKMDGVKVINDSEVNHFNEAEIPDDLNGAENLNVKVTNNSEVKKDIKVVNHSNEAEIHDDLKGANAGEQDNAGQREQEVEIPCERQINPIKNEVTEQNDLIKKEEKEAEKAQDEDEDDLKNYHDNADLDKQNLPSTFIMKKGQIVWAKKSQTKGKSDLSIFAPAKVEAINIQSRYVFVKFVSGEGKISQLRRVDLDNVASFNPYTAGDLNFRNNDLEEAVSEACDSGKGMKQKVAPVVKAEKVNIDGMTVSTLKADESEEEEENVDIGSGWMSNFLQSLDDDSEDDGGKSDKENGGQNNVENENQPSNVRIEAAKNRAPLQNLKVHCLGSKGRVSDYEEIRRNNIDEKNKFLAELGILKDKKELKQRQQKKPKIKPFSSLRNLIPNNEAPRRTDRSTASKKRYSEDDFDGMGVEPKKRRAGGGNGNKVGVIGLMPNTKKGFNPNVDVLTPEQITDEMLENVADKVSEKVYDAENGSSCHQCRQKTLDMKSLCRSGFCVGVRGMFCGVCLNNRYGQDVREALKDAEWACPPCRDKCNCSICRKKRGKAATGVCSGVAQVNGYTSVEAYLDSLKY